MFKKASYLIVSSLAVMGLLAGCAPSLEEQARSPEGALETPAPEPTELSTLNELEFTVTEADVAIYPEGAWEILPAVTNVTENSFVLLSAGSSSCPAIIKTVEHGVEGEIPVVAVTYESQGEQACTDDLQRKAVLVETDGKFEKSDSIYFQLRTIDSLDVTPMRFIPDEGVPEAPGVVENPVEEPYDADTDEGTE